MSTIKIEFRPHKDLKTWYDSLAPEKEWFVGS